MTTSRPSMSGGIDSVCTRFGVSICCRVSAAETRALTPASANVCNEAPECLSLSSYLPRSTGLCADTGREDPSGRRTKRQGQCTRSRFRASLGRPCMGGAARQGYRWVELVAGGRAGRCGGIFGRRNQDYLEGSHVCVYFFLNLPRLVY